MIRSCSPGSDEPCWNWNRGVGREGYGKIWYEGQTISAHRLSFILFKYHPGMLQVCHRCDNRLCVNPSHLFAGTIRENQHDSFRKGRRIARCGELSPATRIPESVVEEIRNSYIPGSAGALAEKFGISKGSVYDIASGRSRRRPSGIYPIEFDDTSARAHRFRFECEHGWKVVFVMPDGTWAQKSEAVHCDCLPENFWQERIQHAKERFSRLNGEQRVNGCSTSPTEAH